MVKILQPAFYAAERSGFVLGVSVAAVAGNITLSVSLMPVLGHVGLALATSLSGLLAATVLAIALARRGQLQLPAAGLMLRTGGATAVMLAVLFGTLSLLPDLPAAVELLILVIVGGGGYSAAAFGLKAVPRGLLRG